MAAVVRRQRSVGHVFSDRSHAQYVSKRKDRAERRDLSVLGKPSLVVVNKRTTEDAGASLRKPGDGSVNTDLVGVSTSCNSAPCNNTPLNVGSPAKPKCLSEQKQNPAKHSTIKQKPAKLRPWQRTLRDLRDVMTLRKQLTYGGYPFSRLIQNQVGDGLLAGAVAGIAVITAGVSPLLAGVLVWATRSIEYGLAVVWNQHMASQRREARLAATEGDKSKALASKHEAAKEMVSSGFYDLLTGVAAVGAIATAIAGGPIGVVIGLGVGVAAFQTLSKFKEIAWGALRFVVNPDPKLQKRMVDLQEPMSAYEMAVNVGVMTLSYLASFSAIAAFYVFLPHVALPVSAGLAVVGCGLMVQAKLKFRQEEREAAAELAADQQKNATLKDDEHKNKMLPTGEFV